LGRGEERGSFWSRRQVFVTTDLFLLFLV
jgi:hypothetical protein